MRLCDIRAGDGQNIAQALVYLRSIGEAMRAATAARHVQAIYATALRFLRPAM